MNNEPVSVIIPTYNRATTIERSVRSVVNQTYNNIEIIIVDDGSVDNTEDIIKSINDPRVTYYKQENMGCSAARNNGVKYAKYDIIAFHDSDDEWMPDKLEKQMGYWDQHPEYDVIYCQYRYIRPDGLMGIIPSNNDLTQLEGDIFNYLLYRNTVGAPTVLMKKELFFEVGGFSLELMSLEDWELAIRIAENHMFGFVNEPLMNVYVQENSVSSRIAESFLTKCKIIAKYYEYLQNNNMLNDIISNLFEDAKRYGILEQAKQMLIVCIQNRN